MDGGVATGKEIVREIRRQNLPFLAGSLAFYAFVSLLPLLLLAVIAASLLAGETVASYILALTRLYLSPAGEDLLATAITDAAGWVGSSLIGLLVLSWAAFRMFLGIDIAFAQLYGTRTTEVAIEERVRDGLIVLAAFVFVLIAAVLTVGAFTLFPDFRFSGIVDTLLLVCGLLVAFFPLYYVFPDVDVSAREALPGALVAALGWTLLQSLFQLYVSVTNLAAVFGVIGGALLFLLWLYFGALVLLVGVVVNVVLAGRNP
ncbi:MAG: YihY/virulence factor BrkB family protein [Halalkalicoccus sp.]